MREDEKFLVRLQHVLHIVLHRLHLHSQDLSSEARLMYILHDMTIHDAAKLTLLALKNARRKSKQGAGFGALLGCGHVGMWACGHALVKDGSADGEAEKLLQIREHIMT